jgi:hypothetical protein
VPGEDGESVLQVAARLRLLFKVRRVRREGMTS